MNILDIMLIIVMLLIFLGGLILGVVAMKDSEVGFGIIAILFGMFIAGLFGLSFVVLDKGSGSTVGEITSVDKNFYGTTAVWIKTSENTQEKYCVEDETVAEEAKELLGKKVKISYGERVGLYSTGSCHQAPIDKIEEIEVDV